MHNNRERVFRSLHAICVDHPSSSQVAGSGERTRRSEVFCAAIAAAASNIRGSEMLAPLEARSGQYYEEHELGQPFESACTTVQILQHERWAAHSSCRDVSSGSLEGPFTSEPPPVRTWPGDLRGRGRRHGSLGPTAPIPAALE